MEMKLLPKAEMQQRESGKKQTDLQSLLLKGPVATKKQLETIENNRKAINKWKEI